MIIWLPRPGKDYGYLQLKDTGTRGIIDVWPVTDKLSGTIQIIWDTVFLSPGRYRIAIDHPDAGMPIIVLLKCKATFSATGTLIRFERSN